LYRLSVATIRAAAYWATRRRIGTLAACDSATPPGRRPARPPRPVLDAPELGLSGLTLTPRSAGKFDKLMPRTASGVEWLGRFPETTRRPLQAVTGGSAAEFHSAPAPRRRWPEAISRARRGLHPIVVTSRAPPRYRQGWLPALNRIEDLVGKSVSGQRRGWRIPAGGGGPRSTKVARWR